MLNVFVVGMSKTGKTPLADWIAKTFGMRRVSGSEWVRNRYQPRPEDIVSRDAFVAGISGYSLERLRQDPDVCIDYIRKTYDLEAGGFVIEGLRNPRDFAALFRPERDVVLFLHFEANDVTPSAFEAGGIPAIRTYVGWLVANDIVSRDRVQSFRLRALQKEPDGERRDLSTIPGPEDSMACRDLDEAMALAVRRVSAARELDPPFRRSKKAFVHAEVGPFAMQLEEKYLYDLDPAHAGKFVDCSVFAVSSYTGHEPTAQALLKNGAVFSYIPFRALRIPQAMLSSAADIPEEELVYHDCPGSDIAVSMYAALVGPVRAYFRTSKRWLNASYLFTVDWYLGNDLLHAVRLETGQIALLPQHKLQFKAVLNQDPNLPRYKKLRAHWHARR